MSYKTGRFGTVEYTPVDVVTFPDGLIGFNDHREFLILRHSPTSEFRWLQSLIDPDLAFLVAPPSVYLDTYTPAIDSRAAKSLELTDPESHFVLVTVAIPKGRPQDMTLNLQAPVVINASKRLGKQIVLDDGAYTTKYRVFPSANRVSVEAA